MLEQLENLKSKWEELAEIDKIAGAWKDVGGIMEMLGYTVDDVLNDTPGAFDAFKEAYIACLAGMNGQNDQYLEGLAQVTGKSVEELKAMMGQIEEVGNKTKDPLDKTAEAIDKVNSSAGKAQTNVGGLATKSGELTENTKDLPENLEGVSNALDGIDGTELDGFKDAITDIRNILVGEDGASGLLLALQTLPEQVNIQPITEQFIALEEAIQGAVTALGGGGGEAPATNGGMGGTGAQSQGTSASHPGGDESGSGAGLVGAIQAVKQAADENIGTGGEEEEGTAIGDFNALSDAVDGVTTAIGGGDEGPNLTDKGYPSSTGDSKTQSTGGGGLIGAIEDLSDTTTELVEGEITPRFQDFSDVIGEAEGHVQGIIEGLQAIDDMDEVECTIKINVEVNGGFPSFGGGGGHGFATGTAMPWDSMNLESASYTARFATGTAYPHFGGSAYVKGDWGVQKGGKSLVGELGQELVSNCDFVW